MGMFAITFPLSFLKGMGNVSEESKGYFHLDLKYTAFPNIMTTLFNISENKKVYPTGEGSVTRGGGGDGGGDDNDNYQKTRWILFYRWIRLVPIR